MPPRLRLQPGAAARDRRVGPSFALLGELTEQHDLIAEAENKIAKAVDLDDSPDIWYSYGMCLSSFARYFNDNEYHYQAIEKFQYSLSIDRTYDRHWHAIAASYADLARLNADAACYELAAKFYSKAIDLRPRPLYIFDCAVCLARWGEMTHKEQLLEDAVVQFEKALSLQKTPTTSTPTGSSTTPARWTPWAISTKRPPTTSKPSRYSPTC